MVFFNRIKESFLNFEMYSQIAYQRKGQTFKYFFILFTILFVLGSLRTAYDFNSRMTALISTARDRLPEFQFANGVLNVEGQQPIKFEGDNNTVIIIDTTGKTTETELDKYSEGVYISGHSLVSKQYFETKEINFSNFKNFNFDKDKIIGLLPTLKWVILPVGILLYFFASVWALITTALLAVAGSLMLKRQHKEKLQFMNFWNISVYTLTLPWILETVKSLTLPSLPYFFIIKWAIALIILNKAIEALNKKLSENNPPPQDILI